MAVFWNPRRHALVAPLAAGASNLYTAPAGVTAVIKEIVLCNTNAFAVTQVQLTDGAANVFYGTLQPNSTTVIDLEAELGPGVSLVGDSPNAGGIHCLVSGLDNNGGPSLSGIVTPQHLWSGTPGTVLAWNYTCPSGVAVVRTINLCNITGSAATCDINHAGAMIASHLSVPPNGTVTLNLAQVLWPGESLGFYQETANAIQVVSSGVLLS